MAAQGSNVVMHYKRHGIPLGHPFKEENVKKCETFNFRDDDVVILGYPKSGNTWLQEMTWLVLNDADVDGATKSSIISRAPLMESLLPGQRPFVEQLLETPGPRIMNTHLPKVFLENALEKGQGRPKVICVMRNPKDLVVSYFHFYNTRPGRSEPDFDDFFNRFMNGSLIFGSYFDFCAEWWEYRNHENFLFVTYEDTKKDHAGTVRNIAKFLGKDLNEDQVAEIVHFTSFKLMRDRPNAKVSKTEESDSSKKDKMKVGSAGFFRKGEVGDWVNEMTCFQSEEIDKKVKEVIDPVGLHFIYQM